MPIDPRVKLTHVMEAVQHRLSHSHTIGEQTKALEEARDEMMAHLRTMPPSPPTTPATDLDDAQKELDAAKAKHEVSSKAVADAEAKVAVASAKVDDEKAEDEDEAKDKKAAVSAEKPSRFVKPESK